MRLSAPGSPWVQELDGPIGIKALFIDNSYVMTVRSHRSTLGFALAALLLGAIIAGCGADNGNPDSKLSLQQATQPLTGAPPQLAQIRSQANELLDGGKDAFDARIA